MRKVNCYQGQSIEKCFGKTFFHIMFYSQLIQRLYNIEKGDMRIENANIDAVNVPWLRSKLGLVSQVNI